MTAKPTTTQMNALALLADGSGYRAERAFSNGSVYTSGGVLNRVTVGVLLRNGWATWGPEVNLRKPLTLTAAGRDLLPTRDED